MSKFKVGDKVRVRIDLEPDEMYGSLTFLGGNMSKCAGQICTIKKVISDKTYDVSENPFAWSEEMLEPMLTLSEIKEKGLDCIIHTSKQEEANLLYEELGDDGGWRTPSKDYWHRYGRDTCYTIQNGRINQFADMDFEKRHGSVIYEFSDLFATGGVCTGFRGGKIPTPSKSISIEEQLGLPKGVSIHDLDMTSLYRPMNIEIQPLELVCNEEEAKEIAEKLAKELNGMLGVSFTKKEEKKMPTKFTFYVTEGTRIDKSCNKTVPTMTTFVSIGRYHSGKATCDKAD